MQAILSIAGSDPSGGAGIQADIKTISAHCLYAETAITALTAQNTLGVYGVEDVAPEFVAAQIDAVFEDIRPESVKVGMVSSVEIIGVIADRLRHWNAQNIVIDPVMVSTSGGKLIGDDAIEALKKTLFPLADVITPNLSESEVLCGHALDSEKAMEEAAAQLAKLTRGFALVKGGHAKGSANDVLVSASGEIAWLYGERIDTQNTHGTGCTLSSAIACNLAMGLSMPKAVRKAKDYVTGALSGGLNLGRGNGPIDHMWEFEGLA